MKNLSTYYELLGLTPDSDLQHIRSAFREKAKLYHPDVNPSPFAQNKFIRIREAFEILAREHQKVKTRQPYLSKDPYNRKVRKRKYYNASGGSSYEKLFKKKKPDFLAGRQGKIIYCTAHLIFILIGLFIFFDPVIIALQHKFDPFRPLYDSIFAVVVTMIFGMAMTWRISLSLSAFIRKTD